MGKVETSNKTMEMEQAVGAAFVASGIGSFVLGIMVVLNDAYTNISNSLKFVKEVGPLSGKTTYSVAAFFLSWAILHFWFRSRPVKLMTAFTIAMVLIVLGILLTFPPIFEPIADALKPK